MTSESRQSIAMVVQFLQLFMLVIGVAGLFMALGRRDNQLQMNSSEITQLKDISTDLVKASIESTTTNREQDRRLDELRSRLARLETDRD